MVPVGSSRGHLEVHREQAFRTVDQEVQFSVSPRRLEVSQT